LRRRRAPDWLWWHTPNGEIRDKREAAKLRAMGVKPCVPDFLLISPYGSVRFLELKRRGEDLSEEQEQFSLHCIRHGIPYSVAHNLDEAIAALNGWGGLVAIGEAAP
jgi:VRR-NUC domain